MGAKTTPSLISKGGYQIPPSLGGREIDTPWEIGLTEYWSTTVPQVQKEVKISRKKLQGPKDPLPGSNRWSETPSLIGLTENSFWVLKIIRQNIPKHLSKKV